MTDPSSASWPAPVRSIVPAYFHPAVLPEQWALLAARADAIRLVIMNPASGPGERVDGSHLPALQLLRDAGVQTVGYVDTNYGSRARHDVIADVGRYFIWYGIDGVCFDRVSVSADHLGHFRRLAEEARKLGAGVVMFNHGAHPIAPYAELADVLGTFEGPWRHYVDLAIPRWTRSLPPERFCHVIYDVPSARSADVALLASRRRVGATFITDRGGGNPYCALPSDWLDPSE